MNFATVFKRISRALVKSAPTILAVSASVGVVGTTVLAVKATPPAQEAMQKIRDAYGDKPAPAKELLKAALPYYAPTFISAGLTIGCIAGSRHLSAKENAVLATLYSTSNVALNEYQRKVVEKLGEVKEKEIHDEIAADHVKANPIYNSEVIMTGKGKSLCFDEMSGRYFLGDYDELHRIENRLGRMVLNEMWASINDFYSEIGLPFIPLGDKIGWDVDHMPEFRFSSIVADDGRPCLVVQQYTFTYRDNY